MPLENHGPIRICIAFNHQKFCQSGIKARKFLVEHWTLNQMMSTFIWFRWSIFVPIIELFDTNFSDRIYAARHASAFDHSAPVENQARQRVVRPKLGHFPGGNFAHRVRYSHRLDLP
jgi:hypothetical protein